MALTEAEIESLRGEVEDSDVYLMRFKEDIVSCNDPTYVHEAGHERAFNFTPDVIFDLGANCGMFSRYSRKLFPNARIISIEPDSENLAIFHALGVPDVLIEGAIGEGTIYRINGAVNGGGESYLSVGLGFTETQLKERATKMNIQTVRFVDLVEKYVREGEKFVVKMDMEGAENIIFGNDEAMETLRRADYFTCELHYYAAANTPVVVEATNKALQSFEATHRCFRRGMNFHAIKL